MDEIRKNMRKADRIGQQLGNYRLLCMLEQGKFSGSFLGEHISSKTQAVVDLLPIQLASDLVQSFLQQTYKIGQLTHPHILHLCEAGVTENSTPFVVLDYVSHITLQQLYAKGNTQPLTRVFPYIQQIGAGLQYAHDKGVLHQRLHPGNILQGWNNDILVCDFIIDAIIQNQQRHSSGQVIDNIAYTAPEQMRGKASPASDQYSLAIIIYEWLSGDLPFHGSSVEIIRRHAHVPPPSLRQKVPMIPPAVEEVLFTALAKDPTKRFSSISAFINALEQAQKPAVTRLSEAVSVATLVPDPIPVATLIPDPVPVSTLVPPPVPTSAPMQNTMRFVAPPTMQPAHVYPQPASPVPIMTSAPSYQSLPMPGTRAQANYPSTPVPTPTRPTPPPQVASKSKTMARAKVKQEMTMTRRAFAMGFTALAVAGGAGAWLELSRQLSQAASNTTVTTDSNNTVSTPDATGKQVLTYRAHPARVTSVAWSPDGKRIASASDDKLVQICNSTNGATLLTYHKHSAEVYAVAWSPDGKYIASASADKTVQIWDASTGSQLLIYSGHSAPVNSVSWSSDSTLVASGSDDKTVQVWSASTGGLSILYSGHTAGILAVAWSPDNTLVASGSWDNTLQAFSTITTEAFAVGDTVFSYGGHGAEIYAIAWSPDGKYIASASADKTVQICRGIDGKTLRTYKGHTNIVLALAWSPDGKRIASAGADTTAQVWISATGQKTFTYHGHTNAIFAAAWSPDGKHIASAGSDNTMQVWQPS